MNPVDNPYTPGAGKPPRELAGRREVLEAVRIELARQAAGGASKSTLLVGLRGVGKTVLLNRIRETAAAEGIVAVQVEAEEGRTLPAMLAPQLRSALIQLSRIEAARALAQSALRVLRGFAATWTVSVGGVEIQHIAPEPGVADSGDLEQDLRDLFDAAGRAAQSAGTAVAIFIDEMQGVSKRELGPLIGTMHQASQRALPINLVGAGLPQIRRNVGDARSYAERMFNIPEIGPLAQTDAEGALCKPAAALGVEFEPDAVARVVERSQGYPYFLQEWGKHIWEVAERSPISTTDVERAAAGVVEELDRSFFLSRLDRITPVQRMYLRAMAELGPGPHRSGDVAERLGRSVTSVSPIRAQLISKGMIWSPAHGGTAFTVPLFDEYLMRSGPELE